MIRNVFMAGAVFLLFSICLIFPARADVSRYLQAGELEEAGDYRGAASVLRDMLKKEKSAYLYSRLVEVLMAAGDGEGAVAALEEAEKNFPGDATFKFMLGELYEFSKKDPDGAYKYYSAAAAISPEERYFLGAARALEAGKDYSGAIDIINGLIKKENKAVYYSDKGRLYQRMGRTDEAVECFKEAVRLGDDIPAMLRLADIYLSSGKTQEAKEILEKITASGQNLILPELKLGEIYQNEKDYIKALELYSSVADKLEGRDRAAVLKQMGSLQYRIGDYDNASRTFQWVTELVPEDYSSAFFSGYIYEYLGEKDKARNVYEKALKARPDYAQILKRMAVMAVLDGDSENALKYASKIVDVDRDVEYYLVMSEAHALSKDYNKAVLVLVEGLNSNPTDTGILYGLAMNYENLGERDKSIEAVKKALTVEPDNPVFLNFLGYLYANMGMDLDSAYEMIRRALEKDPENPAYLDSMGWVYFKKNDYRKAYEYLEKAIKSAPDDPEMTEHMNAIKKKLNGR